jgi:hypothetical protein
MKRPNQLLEKPLTSANVQVRGLNMPKART